MTTPGDQASLHDTEHATVPFPDGDIHVCQDGPRDAPVLLLLHGSAASSRSWDPLVPLLIGSHRVVRIDLLGYGRSAKPDDGDYAIPRQARRVAEVLDRGGARPATVVGHSAGGLVATALAEHRPDLASALALVNTGPRLDAFIGPESGATSGSGVSMPWPPPEEQVRQLAASAFGPSDFPVPQDLVDDARSMTLHSFVATQQASSEYLAQRALPERLAPLGTPLLVVFGEDDRRWRPSSAEDYRVVPGARIAMLSGVGHSPNVEDPGRTAEVLLSFDAEVRSG